MGDTRIIGQARSLAGFPNKNEKALCAPSKCRNPAPSRDGLAFGVLSDLTALHVLAILPLDGLHLVLQTQLQFFQPDFFQFFFVLDGALVGERETTLFLDR